MVSTEELFDMKSDQAESANVAYEEENEATLDAMQQLYDRHLYEIEQNAINDDYRKYKDLFDRRQLWDAKEKILEKSQRKSKSKKAKQPKEPKKVTN